MLDPRTKHDPGGVITFYTQKYSGLNGNVVTVIEGHHCQVTDEQLHPLISFNSKLKSSTPCMARIPEGKNRKEWGRPEPIPGPHVCKEGALPLSYVPTHYWREIRAYMKTVRLTYLL